MAYPFMFLLEMIGNVGQEITDTTTFYGKQDGTVYSSSYQKSEAISIVLIAVFGITLAVLSRQIVGLLKLINSKLKSWALIASSLLIVPLISIILLGFSYGIYACVNLLVGLVTHDIKDQITPFIVVLVIAALFFISMSNIKSLDIFSTLRFEIIYGALLLVISGTVFLQTSLAEDHHWALFIIIGICSYMATLFVLGLQKKLPQRSV